MLNFQILDCTLRDGGYVNDWRFGEKNIKYISEKLCSSLIDIIEVGFLSETKKTSSEQSIFRTIDDAEKTFSNCSQKLALMVNCGEFLSDNIPQYTDGNITTIRIAFHKHQIDEGKELCKKFKSKGYKVFLQPMVTMNYTDSEVLDLIKWANENLIDAFYIVDSFGTMRNNDVLRLFYLINNNLKNQISIGFHSHNNMQLSFSNAQKLFSIPCSRRVIVDSTVYGIGRGAGNLCTELITQFINENSDDRYDLIPVLEIMDECIMPIHRKNPWGYSAPYYIAAINDCHPNYATYLMNLQTMYVRDINAVIKSIPNNDKQIFNPDLIKKLYIDYQQHSIDDTSVISALSEELEDRKVLILATGRSLAANKNEIDNYIAENDPVIIAVNHVPKTFRYDKVFIGNLKRFKGIDDALSQIKDKMICTSNIVVKDSILSVNYSSYLNDDALIADNSGLMLINILRKVGVSSIALAGFDGYSYSGVQNYFDENMINNIEFEKLEQVNNSIIKYFLKLQRCININFITPSIYNESENLE